MIRLKRRKNNFCQMSAHHCIGAEMSAHHWSRNVSTEVKLETVKLWICLLPTFQCGGDNKKCPLFKKWQNFSFLKCHGIDAMAKPELEELLYIWWVYTAIKSPSLRWKVYTTKYVDSGPQSPLHRPPFCIFPIFSIFFHFLFPRYINHSLPSCPPCFPREGLW